MICFVYVIDFLCFPFLFLGSIRRCGSLEKYFKPIKGVGNSTSI